MDRAMSTTKITIDQIPLDLTQKAHAIRESRRTSVTPSPLVRDVYIDALKIGLAKLEERRQGTRKGS